MLNALAEENRFKIVEVLKFRNHTVTEISELLEMRQPQVSKHLKVLNEAGIVTVSPVKQKRVYSLTIEPFEKLEHWSASIRETWNNRLDRMEEYLDEYLDKENIKVKNNESKTKQ